MKRISIFVTALSLVLPVCTWAHSSDKLTSLIDGNRRFADGHAAHPNLSSLRRKQVAEGQAPFAVVVGCADSRVPPEIVFDQGLGDLFVVRSAGEVVDDVALASIEFAVAKLGARLIVVLGHERCGAVQAAMTGGELPGHLGALVDAIKPGITPMANPSADALDQAIGANARAVASRLRQARPVLAPLVDSDELHIVAAVYDLDSGRVNFLKEGGQP